MWPDRHITIHLFHKLLKSCHKLINGLILPLTDIPGHTGADVIGKQFFVKRIYSCIHSSKLDQDIITVGIILKHTDDTPDLSFNTLQPVDQLLTLLLGSVCMLFTAAQFFFSVMAFSPFFAYPVWVFLILKSLYTPLGYFVKEIYTSFSLLSFTFFSIIVSYDYNAYRSANAKQSLSASFFVMRGFENGSNQ